MERCCNCKKKTHIVFSCSICNKKHCLKHRYVDKHDCIESEDNIKEKLILEKVVPKKIDKI
jgi:predicted nucleic acid binding AN1-type Zn finger protein